MQEILRDPYLVGLIIFAVAINLAALGMKMQRTAEPERRKD